ncbi:hypothetical protein EX30DRAFT_398784 [Ascodesmis nigricans]|uniref:Uncharacterized protein n=1 Tax=Ascodesmis nigricans TaxID=341454 RepID=A0A4S2MQZ6_9PEZI|nr:hypothetical protein EX30DRAFT_398784 [Ascodesmis nigricans]
MANDIGENYIPGGRSLFSPRTSTITMPVLLRFFQSKWPLRPRSSTPYQPRIVKASPVVDGHRTITILSFSRITTKITTEIPDVLISRQTIEFLGLREDLVSILFEEYTLLSQPSPSVDFDLYIELQVEATNIEPFVSHPDPWRAALKEMGFRAEFIEAIMDPEFRDFRDMNTVLYWAMDTVRLQWVWIETLGAFLSQRGYEHSSTQWAINDSDIRSTHSDEASLSISGLLIPDEKAPQPAQPATSLNPNQTPSISTKS